MKYLILSLSLAFITLNAASQEDKNFDRSRVSVGTGSVSPLGDLVSDSNGFAGGGISFNIDYAIAASNNMAIVFGFNRGMIQLDEEAINTVKEGGINNSFGVDGSSGKYKMTSFIIGAEARTSGKHYFYVNPYFGLGKLTTPEITYQTFEIFNSIYTTVSNKVTSRSEISTIYGLKLGAHFLLFDHFGVGLFGRYEQGNFRFPGETIVFKLSSNITYEALTTGVNLHFSF